MLGTANAGLVAGGVECAQKPRASTLGRAQSKECVKFNSKCTLPEKALPAAPQPRFPVLNYKIVGGLKLKFVHSFPSPDAS